MEAIIQDLDRYFQHARRTRLNTFTSASVMSGNASKAITVLTGLLNHTEYSKDKPLIKEIIHGLSKAAGIYEILRLSGFTTQRKRAVIHRSESYGT